MTQKACIKLWTPEEDQYLRDNWSTKTRREMANHLGRPSTRSISWRAQALGIGNKSKEELNSIRLSFSSLPDSLVANYLFHDADQKQQALDNPEIMKVVRVKKAHVLLKRIIKKQSQ